MTMREKMARAMYAQFPTYQEVWRQTTTSRQEREKVIVNDTWEEAPDRHAQCFALADAALEAAMEPDEEMITAVLARYKIVRMDDGAMEAVRKGLVEDWQAAIQHILEGK